MLPSLFGTSTTVLLGQFSKTLPALCSTYRFARIYVDDIECDDDGKPKPNRRVIKYDLFAKPKDYKPFTSIWENPPCCKESCEPFRHDIIYLKPSHKKYTRTWVECPDIIKDKFVCTGDLIEPEREKRPRRSNPPPCSGNQYKLGLMTCKPQARHDKICGRVNLPHCVLARVPPQCKVAVFNKCCQKRCTLYPSYSECKRPKPKVLHPKECLCGKIPATCEVYEMFRKFPLK